MRFLCVFERYHVWLFILWKIRVWNGSQAMWDSFQAAVFNVETCFSGAPKTLPVCVESCLRMQVHACVRRPRVSFGLYFPKIDFLFIKKLYFPFSHLSSQFVIWLGPKPTLGLKISASLGDMSLSHKGYEMWCLQGYKMWCLHTKKN